MAPRDSRVPLALILILVAALPLASAFGHEGGLPDQALQDVNARLANVAVHHPLPDPRGDPWGLVWGPDENGTDADYMRAHYGAFWFPTVVVDGLETIEGATSFLPTYQAYEGAVLDRRDVDSPIRLSVTGVFVPPMAIVDVHIQAKATVDSSNLTIRAVLVEDDVRFDGGNGVGLHRFTVRAHMASQTLRFGAGGNDTYQAGWPADPAWDPQRLGFVVWVVNQDAASLAFEEGEVVQAATWMRGQNGPTIQASRGVLVEVYSATWCASCVYGDGAIDELANAYGVPSSRILDRDWVYLRPFSTPTMVVAAVAGLAALIVADRVLAGRRSP